MYEADKKAYFAAHPEKKPKEQRISDWKAKGGDGGKGQGKGQGKGGGRGYIYPHLITGAGYDCDWQIALLKSA